MKIISHRGNIEGPSPETENTRKQINAVLEMGYDVEVDIWLMGDQFYLGHDSPQEPVSINFLTRNHIWVHAKNAPSIQALVRVANVFWHQEDDIALTSRGYLWTHPGKLLVATSIAVLPENVRFWDITEACGLCTDYPLKYKPGNRVSEQKI